MATPTRSTPFAEPEDDAGPMELVHQKAAQTGGSIPNLAESAANSVANSQLFKRTKGGEPIKPAISPAEKARIESIVSGVPRQPVASSSRDPHARRSNLSAHAPSYVPSSSPNSAPNSPTPSLGGLSREPADFPNAPTDAGKPTTRDETTNREVQSSAISSSGYTNPFGSESTKSTRVSKKELMRILGYDGKTLGEVVNSMIGRDMEQLRLDVHSAIAKNSKISLDEKGEEIISRLNSSVEGYKHEVTELKQCVQEMSKSQHNIISSAIEISKEKLAAAELDEEKAKEYNDLEEQFSQLKTQNEALLEKLRQAEGLARSHTPDSIESLIMPKTSAKAKEKKPGVGTLKKGGLLDKKKYAAY